MASTFLQRTAELRNSGVSAIEAARQARAEATSPTASANIAQRQANTLARQGSNAILGSIDGLGGDLGALESGNPRPPLSSVVTAAGDLRTGVASGAITTDTVTSNTNKINAATPTATTNNQGNSSTVTGGGYGTGGTSTVTNANKNGQIEGKTNQVLGDVMSNYDTNKVTDKTQLEETKLATEANAMALDVELKRKQLEDIELAKEEDRIQKQKAADDASNLMALQEKERARNEASIAMAEAKSEAAERELAIANDVELQKSNVAFAKLGLTLSTAAVTSAQQIYTTGVYNLSKLKSENAFKMADLQVAVAKVEFDHTKVINDIINKSSEKSYTIRKELNDDIHAIKNSIIDNRFERQKNIDKAIDTYQQAIKDNEDEVLDKMTKANKTLQENVDSFYSTLKTKEEYNTSKISTLVSSGKWYAISPVARSQYEKGAGLPTGTVARQVQATIGTKIYKQAQEITGLKGVSFSSGDYNAMLAEAQRLAELGVPLDTAINQVVSQYLDKSPEYQNALAKARKANMVKASGGGSSSTGSWTTTTTVSEDEKNIMQTNKAGEIRWIPIPSPVKSVSSTNTSTSNDGW